VCIFYLIDNVLMIFLKGNMKSTIKIFGIIALITVIGFSFIACGGDDDNGNNPLIRVSGAKGFSISLPVWAGKFAS